MIYVLLALLMALVAPDSASARSCTRGTDCYRDCVIGPATIGSFKNASCQTKGVPVDTALLVVEDFEAETLHDNVNFGVTTGPLFGPFNDDTGQSGNVGVNSYWYHNYVNGAGACLVNAGPSGSRTCAFSPCVELKVYHPQNAWGQNSNNPCSQIVRNGEFNLEVSSITQPTGSAGGGSGVFDGQASFAHRVGAGAGSDMGIEGDGAFTPQRTLGITYALAYANNVQASQILGFGEAWKHDEWHPRAPGGSGCGDPSGGDGLSGFSAFGGGQAYFPFYGFMFGQGTQASACNNRPSSFQTDCQTRLNAAIAATGSSFRGTFTCNPDSLSWTGDTSASGYNWLTTFPISSWGCFQGFYQNVGTANMTIDQWFTGQDGIRRQMVHLTGFDAATTATTGTPGFPFLQNGVAGYDQFVWDGYFNGNYSGSPGSHRTVQTTYRYEDNVHVRAGSPVSCSQIGFGGTGGPITPGTPSNVTVN